MFVPVAACVQGREFTISSLIYVHSALGFVLCGTNARICLLSLYNKQQLDKVKNVLKCALVIKGCNLGVAQRGSSKRKCMFSKTWLM